MSLATARVGVIGAGILGLAVARRLAEVEPGVELTVLDKESQVGVHQTGHNSGVAHAGVYYTPGSLKAKLCRRGIELLKPYCEQHGLTYDECGKLIVARDTGELGRLDEIERRGTANGVPGLRRLGPPEMVEIEPYVRGVAALHSPTDRDRRLPGCRPRIRGRRHSRAAAPSGWDTRWPRSSGETARCACARAPATSSPSTASSCAVASTPIASRSWRGRAVSRGSCRSAASTTSSSQSAATWSGE